MPALSLVSAGELRTQRGDTGAVVRPAVRTAGPDLLIESLGKACDALVEAALTAFRRGWIYRLSLKGTISDRIAYPPGDPRPRRLEDADAYLKGRFRFGADTVDARITSVFDIPPPSAAFAEALHGFEWLRHLEVANSDNARKLALALAGEWLDRHARYSKPAWEPHIIGLRLINLFAHGRFIIVGSDLLWRSRLFVSLRDQARVLLRTLDHTPDGVPRLQATAALALAGLCLSDARLAEKALAHLAAEIGRQILPDGGQITRSPEALLESYRVLLMVQQSMDAAAHETQPHLRSALDRMAPMVRFFRAGDGGLAIFNGGGESNARQVTALLEGDEVHGKPFGHAPHSGFQRLASGRTLVHFDVGAPPPGDFAVGAHAGCLSFEMSAGVHRIIVNCGSAADQGEPWHSALRATAAHSTLTLADTSSAVVLRDGWQRRLLGPRLIAGQGGVHTRRSEGPDGVLAEASHEYYVPAFGIVHERRLALSPKGLILSGTDKLIPVRRKGRSPKLAYAIRFHIHPDIRLSLAQGGSSVLLKLANGEGWRFRCDGGALSIEESVHLGSGTRRRAEQLVVAGHIRDEEIACAWLLEQVSAG